MLYLTCRSNTSSQQMRSRCKNPDYMGHGILPGFKLVFDGYSNKRQSLVANIIEDE